MSRYVTSTNSPFPKTLCTACSDQSHVSVTSFQEIARDALRLPKRGTEKLGTQPKGSGVGQRLSFEGTSRLGKALRPNRMQWVEGVLNSQSGAAAGHDKRRPPGPNNSADNMKSESPRSQRQETRNKVTRCVRRTEARSSVGGGREGVCLGSGFLRCAFSLLCTEAIDVPFVTCSCGYFFEDTYTDQAAEIYSCVGNLLFSCLCGARERRSIIHSEPNRFVSVRVQFKANTTTCWIQHEDRFSSSAEYRLLS